MTLEDAGREETTPEHPYWWANVMKYIPGDMGSASKSKARDTRDAISKGWWVDVVDAIFWLGYHVHDYNISGGFREWHANFGLLKQSVCPVARNKTTGTLDAAVARDALEMASLEMSTGRLELQGGPARHFDTPPTRLDAMAYSSSFWAAGIVESPMSYGLSRHALERATVEPDGQQVYLMDGGILDTTGIVSHLQRRRRVVVAFYTNNDDLVALSSTVAYLFGVQVPTDSENSLEGPALAQVFNASYFPDVMRNLTDPSLLRARLNSLPVLENSFLGVPEYTLDTLLIFSNQYSDAFLGSFHDTRIAQRLKPDWPNKFPVGMPTLDANMLCIFQEWKVQVHVQELRSLFNRTRLDLVAASEAAVHGIDHSATKVATQFLV